jgi:hypothetical protein
MFSFSGSYKNKENKTFEVTLPDASELLIFFDEVTKLSPDEFFQFKLNEDSATFIGKI